MLHLIHNLEHVWPKPIRYALYIHNTSLCFTSFITLSMSGLSPSGMHYTYIIQASANDMSSAMVLNNWLVNPTGRPNSWVEVDFMQEHMNYWIKVCHLYCKFGSC